MPKLRIVLTLKEAMARVIDQRTGQPISGRELSRRTDEAGHYVRHRTIHELMNGSSKHIVVDHIPVICEVLGCEPGDLMRLEPVDADE